MSSDNKAFKIAFLISAVTHVAVLARYSNLDLPSRSENTKKLEVQYITSASRKEPISNFPSKITLKKAPPPFITNENMLHGKETLARKIEFNKPDFTRIDIIAIKKKITLPPVDVGKISSPAYMNYYQIVREKIRRAAYQNYTRTDTGEVYLSFVIASDGSIKEADLAESKSTNNPYLKEIALRSVKDASLFPAFPAELDYTELSFNVVISFEVE